MPDRDSLTNSEEVRRGLVGASPGQFVGVGTGVRARPEVAAATEPAERLEDGAKRGGRRRPSASAWFVIGVGAILPIILLAAWQLTTSLGIFSVSQLPSPEMVWLAGIDLAERGLLGQ